MALTKLYWKYSSNTLYLRNNSATGYTAWTISTTPAWNSNMTNIKTVNIVNSLNVTSVQNWFKGATNLTTLTNWSNITGVTNMQYCFYGCSKLVTAPKIPSTVTDLNYCFYGCSKLTSFNATLPIIPTGVTRLTACFYNCASLVDASNIVVGPSVQYFGSCFYGCTKLEEPPNMDNAINIQNLYHAFYGCENMIWPPNFANMTKVTSMEGCFYGCVSLDTSFSVDSITIPNSVTSLAQCFYGCYLFNDSIIIPNGVINMNECFKGCQRFNQSITIPSSVTDIHGCFYDCVQLNKKIFVENVPINHIDTFVGTSRNINIYVVASSEDSSEYITWETIVGLYDNVQFGTMDTDIEFDWGDYHYIYDRTNGHFGIKAIDNKSYYEEIQQPYINNTIYTITSMYETFKDKTNMTISPDIPNSVVDMDFCFYSCTNLETAPIIPASVVDMEHCFESCSSLTGDIIVYNNPTNYDYIFNGIGNHIDIFLVTAASNATALATWTTIAEIYEDYVSIGIPTQGLSFDLGDYRYTCDSNYIRVKVKDTEKTIYQTLINPYINNIQYNLSMNTCFQNCIYLNQQITIPDKTINMGYCFYECINFNQPITIPSSVTNMTACFRGCTSFDSLVTFVDTENSPSQLEYMGGCFGSCTNFNQPITIPNNVIYMSGCFSWCEAFNQPIEIPSSVTDMTACFRGCTSFNSSVTFVDTENSPSQLEYMWVCFENCDNFNKSIIIPNNVIEMTGCFMNCHSLNSSVSLGDSVFYMTQCFYNCISFNQSITIPDSVEYMNSCFTNCSNLNSSIVLGSSVRIMDYCFYGCTSFNQSIIIPSSVEFLNNCFYNCNSLNNIIEINTTRASCDGTFLNTTKKIILCASHQTIVENGKDFLIYYLTQPRFTNNNNVQIGELSATIDANRDTTVLTNANLTVTVSRFRGNNEPLTKIKVIKDGVELNNLTWYDPEDTTDPISLIMTDTPKTFVTTIPNFDEAKTSNLVVTVIDDFSESVAQYATISTNFYTMDFLAGGKEVSFGMKAVQDDLYRLLTVAPSDWTTNYVNYYRKVSGKYVLIDDANAPVFAQDTFYELLYPQGLFKCEMDICLGLDTTASVGTRDGDLYKAINDLGWTSEVIV